jgi:hypothetical protein
VKVFRVEIVCDHCGAKTSEHAVQGWQLIQHRRGAVFHACPAPGCYARVEALVQRVYGLLAS